MRFFHFALLALALMLWSTSAQAKEYTVTGVGGFSCGEWTQYRAESSESAIMRAGKMFSWIQGFLTGYNAFGPGSGDIRKGTDVGLLSWIDNYCKDRPQKDLNNAALEFIEERERRNP